MNLTALITGASSGLGYEFAKLFSNQGYDLIVVARNENKLQELKEELSATQVTVIPKDLSLPNAAEELYKDIQDKGLTVHTLVNNAGVGLNGEFEQLSLKAQQDMIQVNILALTDLTYHFLPDMKHHANKGHKAGILNIASTAAFQPGPKMAVYYASKAYVLSFSEALVDELAGTGIQVTTLCPGATKTNFFHTAKAEHTKLTKNTMNPFVVAKAGFEGFMNGKRVIIPGSFNTVGAYAAKFLPRSLASKIAKNINGT